MSTRSAIMIQTENGYDGIYCHFDGYPEGVGATLLEHYTDRAKVRNLIDLGDISLLGAKVAPDLGVRHTFGSPADDVTIAYGRDRGEKDITFRSGPTVKDVEDRIGHNGYVYVFGLDGKWSLNGKPFNAVSDAAEDEEDEDE